MQRELSSFPIPPGQKSKLHAARLITVEDVSDMKPSEISKESGLTKEEALDLLKLVHRDDSAKGSTQGHHLSNKSRSVSALDMLKDIKAQQTIITFSQQIDDMLGGGVPLTKITEFAGAPGVGKTQMCLQLAVDVQIPEVFGGIEGEAIFIDTEGSFIVERLVDIAEATVKHCNHIASLEQNKEQEEVLKSFNLESLLAGVHYFRCHDYVELIAIITTLPEFLSKHTKVKLVVIDSIAFPFRHDFDDYSLRTRLLKGLAQSLIKIASNNTIAVVMTNQMTTKVSVSQNEQSRLIPALGESWGHAPTVRVILYWENSQRHALLYKSPSKEETTVLYQVTTGGIRDCHVNEAKAMDSNQSGDVTPPAKRPRTDT